MTPEQKTLVCDSFAQLVPTADAAAVLFYDRLFELDPDLRLMFKGSMAEQRRKLMTMIAAAVKGLDHLDELVPALEDLGRRHAGYGVRDEHYGTVAAALLWTLERGLGEDFTPPVRQAWTDCYGLLAGVMQRAANLAHEGQSGIRSGRPRPPASAPMVTPPAPVQRPALPAG